MGTFSKSTMGSKYFTFIGIKPNNKNAQPPTTFSGRMIRVRFDRFTRGSSKTQFNLFLGNSINFFDLVWWWWPKVTPFSAYFAKEGRMWIDKQFGLKKSKLHKWPNKIPFSTSPMEYHLAQSQPTKKTTFLWSVIHKAVAVNEWRR